MSLRIATRTPWLAVALVAAALLIAACDDDNGDNGIATTTPTAGAPTPTATQDGGNGGTAAPGGTSNGDAREAYASALELALQDDIGSEAPGDLLSDWDINVTPDGEGLPEGSGTVEAGGQIYATQCAACHGTEGQGGIGPRLWSDHEGAWEPGAPVTIGSYWPYATTVYDYIARAMPFYEPGTLEPDEVYAVTAFLLAQNRLIDEGEEMNQDTLPQVEMPARDLFEACWPDGCYDEYGRGGD